MVGFQCGHHAGSQRGVQGGAGVMRRARFRINAKARARVMKATVRIDQLGGQGVLVPGSFILTATHCVKWNGEGGMAMGDRLIETSPRKTAPSSAFRYWRPIPSPI
jgi:hypothetical protein